MAYEPEPFPDEPAKVAEYLRRQLELISANMQMISGIQLDELHVAPAKPRTGMLALADGTDWNPGSGQGLYTYYGGKWNILRVVASGTVVPFSGITIPAGWLSANGADVSRTTYAAMFAALTQSAVVTMTIASPCVVTWTGHPLQLWDKVSFENSGGALPTGVSVGTNYFVSNVLSANTFRISATIGGADINTSGSQSGVQTCRWNPHGCGNGTTTFTLPDGNERTIAGKASTASRLTAGNSGVRGNVLGYVGGDERLHLHSHGVNDPGHQHTWTAGDSTPASFTSRTGQGDGNNNYTFGSSSVGTGISIQNAGAGGSQNVQPTIIMNYIVAI